MVGNLTVIIPFYNGHETILRLIDCLPKELPIIIVDDLSEQPLERMARLAALEREGAITILRLRQKGYFAGAVNVGIQNCKTDVLILNQDVWFEDERWVGLVDDRRNEGFAMIGERIKGEHPAFPQGYIHGTFMFMRRDAIEKVGMLNAKDYPLWGNTAEWQWRAARRGFHILPLTEIPGFRHERRDDQRYGSSITQLLEREPDKKSLFVRTPPMVSVIVPCHNYGRYLPDCIASLIGGPTSLGDHPGQTMQSFEVIIVDDASTDETAEMGSKLADDWKGIRYFRLDKNVGTARALNFGIERAVGKYTTFLSADDMREASSLEKLVRCCEENPHSFAYDDIQMFGSGKLLRQWRFGEFDFELLLTKNHVHAGILYPRQAWVEAGGYPAAMNDGREDWAFNIALGQTGWCGVHVRHYGYLYRREGQNRSLTNTSPEHREHFLDKIRGIFLHLYEGRRPVGCCGGKKTSQSKSKNGSGNRQAAPMALTGSQGMVRLRYSGAQMSSIWTGHVTNTAYRFGADKPIGWVDVRDAGELPSEGQRGSGFLSLRKHGEWLFNVFVEEKSIKATAKPVNLDAKVVNENDDQTEDGDTLPPTPDGEAAPDNEAEAESNQAEIETAEMDAVKLSPAHESEIADELTTEAVVEAETAESSAIELPDPKLLTVAEVKALELTPEQWNVLHEMELAGLNRRGVIEHVEKLLAP